MGNCAYSVIPNNAKFPKKDVLPTLSEIVFISAKSDPVGSSPKCSSLYFCIKLFLNSLEVCNASKEASPADEYAAIAILLAFSLNPAIVFVVLAIFKIADSLAARSAIDDIFFSRIAAASIFLPAEKALDVFLNSGVNNLNA